VQSIEKLHLINNDKNRFRSKKMKYPAALLGTLGLGAGLMYFLDPNRGKRRRALVKDQAVHLSKVANRELARKAADARNRAQGVWLETEKFFESETLTDAQLFGRIRSKLGRISLHPHAIKTSVEGGKVTLTGLILADEVETVIKGITAVSGVNEIENKLEVHETSEHISSLQGNNRAARIENHKTDWSPKMRAIAATAGGGLALLGLAKRNTINSVLSSVGVGLLTRSIMNKPINKLIVTNAEKAITVQKSIAIDAPPEEVFEVLKHPKYFPYFMSHVQKVESIGEKQYLWTVAGIAGIPVEWTTEVTDIVPNKLIKWKNAGDKKNGQDGFVRLEDANGKGTRLHVGMNYQPIAGKVGHFVAGLFNRDPKSELNDDLLRLKTYIEKGKLPHDAAVIKNYKRRNEMKVKEIMSEDLACCTLHASLHDVAQMMNEFDCGCIPVFENEGSKKPIGMITDRDITIRTVSHNKNPLTMIVGEVMTDNVVTVTPEMSIEDCVAIMERNQIRRVAVVDENGELCGMVAQADIARKAPIFETAELVKDVSMSSHSVSA
jgi:uncharacterized membrane protein/CBS domain-containing protein